MTVRLLVLLDALPSLVALSPASLHPEVNTHKDWSNYQKCVGEERLDGVKVIFMDCRKRAFLEKCCPDYFPSRGPYTLFYDLNYYRRFTILTLFGVFYYLCKVRNMDK